MCVCASLCVCVCVCVCSSAVKHWPLLHSIHCTDSIWHTSTHWCSWNITHASLFSYILSLYRDAAPVLGYLMFCNQCKWISRHMYEAAEHQNDQCVHAGLRYSCDRGCSLLKFTITPALRHYPVLDSKHALLIWALWLADDCLTDARGSQVSLSQPATQSQPISGSPNTVSY